MTSLTMKEEKRLEIIQTLGPADSPLADISNTGDGRYAIVGRELLFSSSDNSDARKNGRSYLLRRR
jgi:hypothetical protein